MKEIVIFGAGEWGRIAYFYYSKDMDIKCYIDNDESIWNTTVNGIPVYPPEILKEQKYTVVIANKRYEPEIKKQLFDDYSIKEVIIFRIEEKMEELFSVNSEPINVENIIIRFSHGLGNQMFQYALYRIFLKQGKKIKADLSAYIRPDMMPFELLNVFPNIILKNCDPREKEYYLKKGKENIYIEEPPSNEKKETYQEKLLNMERGYIEGFHCSYKYSELIRAELLHDFEFPYQNSDKLCDLKTIFEKRNIVGVHIRRGDFLNPKYQREMGICSIEYYLKAIDYIKQKESDIIFCFFSNDIGWVKNNIKEKNALYLDRNMFTEYYDWYDMYLMSICKHNIIPNSTFGWWGAWLNRNPNKIVIAPRQWRKRWKATDWCPPEWILL